MSPLWKTTAKIFRDIDLRSAIPQVANNKDL